MVGRPVLVCGPPLCGACCDGAWPPSSCRVLWWCLAPRVMGRAAVLLDPLMVGRAVLVRLSVCVVGGLVAAVFVVVLGRVRRSGLWSACGVSSLCPGRHGRAGLLSACGAPPRVVVSLVSLPCCSFSLVHPPLSCVSAVAGRVLAVLPSFTPPLGLCYVGVVVGPLFFLSPLRVCWLVLLAACGWLRPPAVPLPPPSPGWFRFRGCLRLAAGSRVLALCFAQVRALALCPRGLGFLLPPPPPLAACCAGVDAAPLVLPRALSACLFLHSVWLVRGGRLWLLCPPPLPLPDSVSQISLSCPFCSLCLLATARSIPPPHAECLLLFRGRRCP